MALENAEVRPSTADPRTGAALCEMLGRVRAALVSIVNANELINDDARNHNYSKMFPKGVSGITIFWVACAGV